MFFFFFWMEIVSRDNDKNNQENHIELKEA